MLRSHVKLKHEARSATFQFSDLVLRDLGALGDRESG